MVEPRGNTSSFLFEDNYIGPYPKFLARGAKCLQVEERTIAPGFRASRVRQMVVHRSPHRGKAAAVTPEPRTECEDSARPSWRANTASRLSSGSHSPIKPTIFRGGKDTFSSSKAAATKTTNYQSLADLLTESAIAKKYLLVRPNPLLTRPRQSLGIRALTPVTERRRVTLPDRTRRKNEGEDQRRRNEADEQRIRSPPPRKEDRISVKDAMRDKEWLQKARDGILSTHSQLLLQSNGVAVEAEPAPTFKYFLGPGNNAHLVKTVMSNRWWWSRTDEEEKATANLVWTQWIDPASLERSSPVPNPCKLESCRADPASVSTSVRYNPSNGPYRQLLIGKAVDLSPLNYDLIFKSRCFTRQRQSLAIKPSAIHTHNKVECNHHLANKKALFLNMRLYYDTMGVDPYERIPLTFHIKDGENDSEFEGFVETYREVAAAGGRNVWILKPGENTNRGTGITLCNSIEQVREEMAQGVSDVQSEQVRTFILQKYIEKPFLIHKRKFDIRLYALVTAINGVIQGYFYSEGYIRTSSKEFSLNNIANKLIHLTNDAVQKYSDDYGKFEMANKLSYSDFQRYLDSTCKDRPVNFTAEVVPKLKQIVKDTIQAVFLKLDPSARTHSFEVSTTQIFGYDFMLDESLNPWLIEVNTNPCLELSSPLLARVIPSMLENSLRYCPPSIALDPYFPEPPARRNLDPLPENKYELIFNSAVDGKILEDALGDRLYLLSFEDPGLSDERGPLTDTDGC